MALTDKLSAIGDAIRVKTGKTEKLTLDQMPQEILGIQSGGGGGDVNVKPLKVTENGTYEEDGYAYSPVNVDINTTITAYFEPVSFDDYHVVFNGVDYDNNIELIPIGENEETVYLLYDCRQANSFCRVRVGGNVYIEYGFCKDGVFTSIGERTSVASSAYYAKWLDDIGYDYLVFKVTQQSSTAHLSYVQTYAWVAADGHNQALGANCNTALMRYGRLPYGTDVVFQSQTLLSDNIMDFAAKRSNTALTLTSAYSGNIAMRRVRFTGWNVCKNGNYTTSLASMFSTCYQLTDDPEVIEMTGWCTSKTTTIASMFANCYNLRAKLIVKDWDLSGCTRIDSIFSTCRALTTIEGLETWTGGDVCTRTDSMFTNCMSLNDSIDLRGIKITNKFTTLASMFNACYRIKKIFLPDMDLTNVTTVASMFNGCYSLTEVVHGTITPPLASKLTNVSSAFATCYSIRNVDFFRGWDLTNANYGGMFQYNYSLKSSDEVDFTGTKFPNYKFATGSSTPPFNNCINAIKVDYSWWDNSNDTGATPYMQTNMQTGMTSLVELYPPRNLKAFAFSLSSCPKLSHDSLMRVIDGLPTTTTTLKLTLGAINLAKLSDAEKAIATEKGWTLA